MAYPIGLEGRNVLVTGAAQGIGQATAQLLYDIGANLTLLDIKRDELESFASSLDPQRVITGSCSVTDRSGLQRLVEECVARFGGVHGLVNNAGVTKTAMIEQMTVEDWDTVIAINLTGVFNCLQIAGADMLRRAREGDERPGAIVNISSDAGRKGTLGQINYGAAKAGVLGITMSAAREWGRYGIRVNSACYGVVATEMTEVVRGEKFRDKYLSSIPLGRFLEPSEAARSIVFLLSDGAAHITGQHLSVNGGSFMTA